MPVTSEKIYYKIGDACKELDIQPYVLRYWETEFPFLKPKKSKSGQRVYSAEDLSVIRRIKELLYEEGYTIAGAKKKLEAELGDGQTSATNDTDSPEPTEHDRKNDPAAGASKVSDNDDGLAAESAGEVDSPRQLMVAALDTPAEERLEKVARKARGLRSEAKALLEWLNSADGS